MSLESGTYLITSAKPNVGHLDLPTHTVPTPPFFYFIIGSTLSDGEKVTATGRGTYTLHSTTHTKMTWILKVTNIVAQANVEPGEFSIEPAGEGLYKIHVPDADMVATLGSPEYEQLHVAPQVGTDSQLWKFTRLDD